MTSSGNQKVERGGWPLSMAETAAALQSRPGDDNPGKETGLRSLPTDGCDPKEEKCDNKHRLENCSRPQAGVPTER